VKSCIAFELRFWPGGLCCKVDVIYHFFGSKILRVSLLVLPRQVTAILTEDICFQGTGKRREATTL